MLNYGVWSIIANMNIFCFYGYFYFIQYEYEHSLHRKMTSDEVEVSSDNSILGSDTEILNFASVG